MNTIQDIMRDLIAETPQLTMYKGLGHCIYGSALLDKRLKEEGMDSCVLGASLLRNTLATREMRRISGDIILSMRDDMKQFSSLRKAFIRRGNSVNPVSGHAVVLVDATVYDTTSGQFGLPDTYSFDTFASHWEEIKKIEVTTGDLPDEFMVAGIKHLETYDKMHKVFVPYKRRATTSHVSSEGFFKW